MTEMFSNVSGDGPMGLWDPGKATSQFQGEYQTVGGSTDGHFPGDDYHGPATSKDYFNMDVGGYAGGVSDSGQTI